LFTVVSSVAFVLIYGFMKSGLSRSGQVFAIFLIVSLTAAAILWEPLYSRFAKISTEFTAERARLVLYKDTWRIFLHFPVVGTGVGTFMQIFPIYRTFFANDVYRYAHNDYLQLLSEMGLAAFIILIAFFKEVLGRLRHLITRPTGRILLIQIAAFCSLLSIGLHSTTDFGIQIPAIAILTIATLVLFLRTPAGNENVI
jgi:O-antigen ligase